MKLKIKSIEFDFNYKQLEQIAEIKNFIDAVISDYRQTPTNWFVQTWEDYGDGELSHKWLESQLPNEFFVKLTSDGWRLAVDALRWVSCHGTHTYRTDWPSEAEIKDKLTNVFLNDILSNGNRLFAGPMEVGINNVK